MNELISVVVPIHKPQKKLLDVCHSLHLAITPIEIIYVVHDKLVDPIKITKSYEHIIRVPNKGRGYMIVDGTRLAKGDIIVFLHSDTILPKDWDVLIRQTMQNKNVIGGGFSLKFDPEHFYLTLMKKLIKILVRMTKVLSGDRAIFIRFEQLKKDLSFLEIPIMEDIALSFWMKKHGKVVLLKQSVITSADAFTRNGFICQSWKIFKCLAWYKLKGDVQNIYRYYYDK